MEKIIYNITNLSPKKQSEKEKKDFEELLDFTKRHPLSSGIWFAFLGSLFGTFLKGSSEFWYLGYLVFVFKALSSFIFATYFSKKLGRKNILVKLLLTITFYIIISFSSSVLSTWIGF